MNTRNYLSVAIFLLAVLKALSECSHEKPQWFMQFGLREIPNTSKYNQRIKFNNDEVATNQKSNEFQLIPGVLTECSHEKPQWFMQFSLRVSPNTSKYAQRIKFNNDEVPFNQKSNELQLILDYGVENTINEDVKHSPLPLVLLGDKHYYFGTYFKANFFQALQFCEDHGMNLLSIESKNENEAIIDQLKKHHGKIENIWISGTDLGIEGDFVWLPTGKHLNYSYFAVPPPDNAGKIEHCLEIWKLKDAQYIWNDAICANHYNFVCELKECTNFCTNSR